MRTLLLSGPIFGAFVGGCGDGSACGKNQWPDEATAPTGTLLAADDCGFWALTVGDHLVVNVEVSDHDATCEATLSPGITQSNSPIYSDFDTSKWTYEFQAAKPEDPYSTIDVKCDDGHTFDARIVVEAAS